MGSKFMPQDMGGRIKVTHDAWEAWDKLNEVDVEGNKMFVKHNQTALLAIAIGLIVENNIETIEWKSATIKDAEFTYGNFMQNIDKWDIIVMYVRAKHQHQITYDENGKKLMETLVSKYCDVGLKWLWEYCSNLKSEEFNIEKMFNELKGDSVEVSHE